MSDRKNLSETLRIDLIPGTAGSAASRPEKPPAKRSPLKVNWPKQGREPPAVSRSRYQELLQSVYDAAVVTNVYGRITDTNGRALDFLQYSREELCSLQVFDVISGTSRQLLETLCKALENERFTLMQAYCRRHDGTFFPAEIAVNMLRFGQVYLCFFIRDTTRRKQVEDRLRTEHEALHNAAAGIVIADLEARIEYGNPAFARAIEMDDSSELVGKDLRDFLADPQGTIGAIEQALNAGEAWQAELELRQPGGGTISLACSATCSRDDEGVPVNLVFSFAPQDAGDSAQKIAALEEELRDAQDAISRLSDSPADQGQ